MSNNSFFKPTALYKEFMILDLIEKDQHITQREISKTTGVAVSMINSYLNNYEKVGLIRRKKHSTKTVEYFVTKRGVERRKLLNIEYLKASQDLYNSAKENIELFLKQIGNRGFTKLLLYGAGEVAEILLQTLTIAPYISIEVVGVIDDDINKQNKSLIGFPILPIESVDVVQHDGILISSYSNKEFIKRKLMHRNYNIDNILNFFEF